MTLLNCSNDEGQVYLRMLAFASNAVVSFTLFSIAGYLARYCSVMSVTFGEVYPVTMHIE